MEENPQLRQYTNNATLLHLVDDLNRKQIQERMAGHLPFDTLNLFFWVV